MTKRRDLPPVHEAWLPREYPTHSKRHGRRPLIASICAVLFVSTAGLSWLLGVHSEQPEYSEPVENRTVADFPNVTQGWGFFTGIGEWATDQLPFQEPAVRSVDASSPGVLHDSARAGGGADVPTT